MIYKRGSKYCYEFIWNGKRVRESAKTGNPRTARQIESARKTELAKGEVGIKDKAPAPPPFEDFSERFKAWLILESGEGEYGSVLQRSHPAVASVRQIEESCCGSNRRTACVGIRSVAYQQNATVRASEKIWNRVSRHL